MRFDVAVFNYIFFCHFRWIYVKPEEVNYYEEYLGTREEQEAEQLTNTETTRVPKRGKGGVSTIVSNHISFLDIMCLIVSPFVPGFVSKSVVETLPFFGTIATALQSLYIFRGDAAQRDAMV